jgi:cobalt-zinc-cadmium efflux system protein
MMTSMNEKHNQPTLEDDTGRSARRLDLALFVTLAFVFVEAAAGILANSLALLTDAAHNFTDVLALALSGYAIRLARRPAHAEKTFGYHRMGILVALVNSTTLALIAIGVFYEAFRRLLRPPLVNGSILIGVAALAFAVNAGTAWLVRRGSHDDLNIRSAFVHLAADAVSTLGAIVAGIGMKLTGWRFLDPAASLLIGGVILWSAWGIIRETIGILLESTPADVDLPAVVRDLMAIDGVRDVHDLHIWSINQSMRALSAHILTNDISIGSGSAIQARASEILSRKYGITHATLQLECEGCTPGSLYCDWTAGNSTHGLPH